MFPLYCFVRPPFFIYADSACSMIGSLPTDAWHVTFFHNSSNPILDAF